MLLENFTKHILKSIPGIARPPQVADPRSAPTGNVGLPNFLVGGRGYRECLEDYTAPPPDGCIHGVAGSRYAIACAQIASPFGSAGRSPVYIPQGPDGSPGTAGSPQPLAGDGDVKGTRIHTTHNI